MNITPATHAAYAVQAEILPNFNVNLPASSVNDARLQADTLVKTKLAISAQYRSMLSDSTLGAVLGIIGAKNI